MLADLKEASNATPMPASEAEPVQDEDMPWNADALTFLQNNARNIRVTITLSLLADPV